MKRLGIYSTLLLGLLLTAVGCIKDEPVEPSAEKDLVKVPYTVVGMVPGTKATPAESGERRIDDVHIMFFNDNGDFVSSQHANVTSGTSSFSFPVPAKIIANQEYRTLIVGNAHSYKPAGYTSFDDYLTAIAADGYDKVRQHIYAQQASVIGTSSALPMWGEMVDGSGSQIKFKYNELADGTKIFNGSAYFRRIVCRLDLRNMATTQLIIEKVKLCNYRSQGYYFHNDAPLGEINSGLSGSNAWVNVGDPIDGVQEVKSSLYAFPNISAVVSQNDEYTTYIMIAGYYQDGTDNTPAQPKKKLTYYRFNMAENGRSQILRRNYLYKGTINTVKGPGSNDENGASSSATSLLGYNVSDTWEDDDSNTSTDENGNFLTISRSSLQFDGYKDLSQEVKIKVKDGQSWTCTWLSGGEYFKYEKTTEGNLRITTLVDNATAFANSGVLQIKSATNTQLSLTISVMQLSSAQSEVETLLVDGQVGTFNITIPGEGSKTDLLVQTGTSDGLWVAESTDMGAGWGSATFTDKGGNNSYLIINAPANLSKEERTMTITVKRVNTDGSDMDQTRLKPVVITVTQPASTKALSISPSFSNNSLTINGFSASRANPNGISYQKQINVLLADPENTTWTATSSFRQDCDLIIVKDNPMDVTKAAAFTNSSPSSVSGNHGEHFWINVFRTGPGDPDIKGTLTINAINKTTSAVLQTYTLNVTITTAGTCVIGDVDMGTYIVADRNMGTPRMWDDDGNRIPARNYTNDAKVVISGNGAGYTSDKVDNLPFKGGWYSHPSNTSSSTYAIADCSLFATTNENESSQYYKSAGKGKWRLPSKSELDSWYSKTNILFSKQRAFLLQPTKDELGHYVGCFLSLSGASNATSDVRGFYWSSTPVTGVARAYSLSVDHSSYAVTSGGSTSYGRSVRCVRSKE